MSAFPFLKLSGLFVKMIAKPLAARMKNEASKNEWLTAIFIRFGNYSNMIQSRVNVFANGYKFMGVKPLPPSEALDKAVDFLSESIVVSFGTMIIVVEYVRSERKNAEKAASTEIKEAQAQKKLNERFDEILQRCSSIQMQLDELEQVLPPMSEAKLNSIRKNNLEKAAEAAAAVKKAALDLARDTPSVSANKGGSAAAANNSAAKS